MELQLIPDFPLLPDQTMARSGQTPRSGIQAQTVTNFFLAFEAQLSIIPVVNKIDLKNADPERVEKQIEKMVDIPASDCIRISAKLGTNVESILQEVVRRLPPPKIEKGSPLKALLFDSTFDHYRGVVASIALCGGDVYKGNKSCLPTLASAMKSMRLAY